MASTAFSVNLLVIGFAVVTMNAEQWQNVLSHLSLRKEVSSYELPGRLLRRLACVFRPGKYQPTKPGHALAARRTTRLAMAAVMFTMIVTSPVLTALSIGLVPDQLKATQSERFISELGLVVGGFGIKLAVVLTASSLLLFASNTAIIGSYHVFLALARQGFLPRILELRNRAFNTPYRRSDRHLGPGAADSAHPRSFAPSR